MNRFAFSFILVLAVGMSGCVEIFPFLKPSPRVEQNLAKAYTQEGRNAEKRGDLGSAMIFYQIATHFVPQDTALRHHMDTLAPLCAAKSEQHVRDAEALMKKNRSNEARRHLLTALRYSPSHEKARRLLASMERADTSKVYVTRQGDTAKKIAREVYGHPNLDFLVSYFAPGNSNALLPPDTVLNLPRIAPEPSKLKNSKTVPPPPPQKTEVEICLESAHALIQSGQYTKALDSLNNWLKSHPESPEIMDLRDQAAYAVGLSLRKKGKFPEALQQFIQVKPAYKDTARQIKYLRNNMKRLAQVHYRKGVRYYVNEELEKAVGEWKKTLRLDPDHKKAKTDIQNARRLMEKLNTIR